MIPVVWFWVVQTLWRMNGVVEIGSRGSLEEERPVRRLLPAVVPEYSQGLDQIRDTQGGKTQSCSRS